MGHNNSNKIDRLETQVASLKRQVDEESASAGRVAFVLGYTAGVHGRDPDRIYVAQQDDRVRRVLEEMHADYHAAKADAAVSWL